MWFNLQRCRSASAPRIRVAMIRMWWDFPGFAGPSQAPALNELKGCKYESQMSRPHTRSHCTVQWFFGARPGQDTGSPTSLQTACEACLRAHKEQQTREPSMLCLLECHVSCNSALPRSLGSSCRSGSKPTMTSTATRARWSRR